MKKQMKKVLTTALVTGMVVSNCLSSMASAAYGWKETGAGWKYQKADGTYQDNGWLLDSDAKWYYFNESGFMSSGWLKEGNSWFYLNPVPDGSRGSMKTGWVWDNGNWYYLNPVSNGSKGAMQTGWIKDGDSWFFADSSGAMQTGVVEVGGRVYYLNPVSDGTRGAMKTGNVLINGKQYTFDASGAAVGTLPAVQKRFEVNGFAKAGTATTTTIVSSSSSSGSSGSSGGGSRPSRNNYTVTRAGEYNFGGRTYTNLYISSAVGDGEVVLTDVNVTGNVFVQGGGANSVYFKNCNVKNVKADKAGGEQVKIVLEGTTRVTGELTVARTAKIVLNNDLSQVAKIIVQALAAIEKGADAVGNTAAPEIIVNTTQKVEVAVPAKEVSIEAKDAEVEIRADVEAVKVEKTAENASVSIAGNAGKVTVDGKADINISGRVAEIAVNVAINITVSGTIENVTVGEGINKDNINVNVEGSGSIPDKDDWGTEGDTPVDPDPDTPDVDRASLEAAITAATEAKADVSVSLDGYDIEVGRKWTTTNAKETFDAAILAARAVLDNTAATQDEVNAAKASLDSAVTAFNTAVKEGIKANGTITDGNNGNYVPGLVLEIDNNNNVASVSSVSGYTNAQLTQAVSGQIGAVTGYSQAVYEIKVVLEDTDFAGSNVTASIQESSEELEVTLDGTAIVIEAILAETQNGGIKWTKKGTHHIEVKVKNSTGDVVRYFVLTFNQDGFQVTD